MLTLMTTAAKRLLEDITDTGAELDGCLVRLFKNDITPAPTDVFEDYENADFSGYVPSSAIVWGTVFVDATGKPTTVGDTKQFTQTAATVSNTIYGYYVVNATTQLVYAERFSTPVEMNAAGNAVVVVPEFQLSDSGL